LLRLLRLLRLAQLSRQAFSLEGLRYAALLAVFTIVAGGAAFVAFEKHSQHLTAWEGAYWAVTTMTTVGSSIYPTTTGSQIVAVVIVIIGICFVALLTGAVAQRFLGPELADVEAELASGPKSAEAVAMRELKGVREQLQALELAMQRLVDGRRPD
ncbi:MAG: ion channel, partial [Solirubrobacterales bacterium]